MVGGNVEILVVHNGEAIENGLGFCVARDMARLLSLSQGGIYEVMDNGLVLLTFWDGNRIDC